MEGDQGPGFCLQRNQVVMVVRRGVEDVGGGAIGAVESKAGPGTTGVATGDGPHAAVIHGGVIQCEPKSNHRLGLSPQK